MTLVLVDPSGQRQLDEQRVDAGVGVQLRHLREQLVLGRRVGQPQVDRAHPASVAALCLRRM